MRKVIRYHSIEYGANVFATPSFTHMETVDVESEEKLDEYIESQADLYGHSFDKSEDKFLGYDYVSAAGGVKVSDYEEPKIKEIK